MGAQELKHKTLGAENLLEGCDSHNYENTETNREQVKVNLSALVTDQRKAPVIGKGEDNGQGVTTWETGRTIEIHWKPREELVLDRQRCGVNFSRVFKFVTEARRIYSQYPKLYLKPFKFNLLNSLRYWLVNIVEFSK